jgi:DNA replicative helicase MCM subunit Mcm2 (Cdc46/Mcm family)
MVSIPNTRNDDDDDNDDNNDNNNNNDNSHGPAHVVDRSHNYNYDNKDWTMDRLVQASYKDLGTPSEVINRFVQHLLTSEQCRHDVSELMYESSVVTRDYSIPLDTFDLINRDPILGYMLLQYPQTLLSLLEVAVVKAQIILLRELNDTSSSENAGDKRRQQATIKGRNKGDIDENNTHRRRSSSSENDDSDDSQAQQSSSVSTTTRVHARLVHLPPHCCKISLGSLDASDVGKIWQVSGTVVRVGPVQMYESARTYKCCGVKPSYNPFASKWGKGAGGNGKSSKNDEIPTCGRTFQVYADLEQQNNALQHPEHCPLRLVNDEQCPGNKFDVVPEGSVQTDYQEIKIQESAGGCNGSSNVNDTIPRSLLIKLQHDLVDHCQPGDEVVVVGILLAQWPTNSMIPDFECQVGIAMSAHSIRVVADQSLSAWKHTTTSTSTAMAGRNNTNKSASTLGDMEKNRKEFEAYWNNPISIASPILSRDFICKAICPKLYGLQVIKLALLITLIGGVSSDVYEVLDGDENNSTNHRRSSDENDAMEAEPFQLIMDENTNNRRTGTSFHPTGSSSNSNGDPNQPANSTKHTKKKSQSVRTRRRDMSHLLLVGDPGTGKSQFLRFAAALCPRSVLTTGVGTTSAGLTCAAVRDGSSGNGKEFALEAGALVLADKGVCCIDEFGCIQKSDRTTIHEAMEQQTLSIAKAGIVCKLNCRTTIIAVMNPINCLYDNHASLSANTGLGTPLLSRFDLIFKLVDTSDAERDSNVTTYLLNRAIQGVGFDSGEEEKVDNPDTNNETTDEANRSDMNVWSMEKLRAYIAIVKERFQPTMSNEPAMLLERHYEKCRSQASKTIPVTVRFLESLIRLCQAHARLMFRNTVTLEDAVAVIQVMESSAFAYGGFDGVDATDYNSVMYQDPMNTDFSPEADLDFILFEYRILKRYDMLMYMDDTRRRQAIAEFERETIPANNNDSWQNFDNNLGQIGYYTSQSNPPTFANSDRTGNAFFTQTQPTMSEDHYGRLHPSSTQSKRPRH